MEGNGEEEIASNSGTDQEVTPSATMEKIPEKCSRDLSSNLNNQEDQLQHARVEMGEVREENERLKSLLPEIVQDYQSLQKHVIDVLRREKTCRKLAPPTPPVKANWENDREPEELVVSLTLGRSPSGKTRTEDARNIDLNDAETEDEMSKEELRLRLGCTYPEQGSGEPAKKQPSHESIKELKEDEIAEIWPPSKILKTMKSAGDEPSQPTQVKRARVSVRVRCDTPTINDGCQWRKYGQKIAKGNPCPRAYYRCTASPSCPVRKQVQRCAEDMSVLITTYEGDHNHPLSVSATAMASTTSAAASVLQSRSSSSFQQDPEASTTPSNNSITTTSASLHGLDFSSSRDWKLNQLYFPKSSISTCSSHPTITLDLTTPINASNYNRFTSNLFTSHPPKHSSTSPCLDFSSSSTSLGSSQLISPWDSLKYGAKPTARSIQFQNGSLNLGRQATHEHPFKPYLQMNGLTGSSHQSIMTDTVATTTAIPTSPYFHSILMAALSSCVGSGLGYRDKAENSDLKCFKPGGSSSADSAQMSSQNQVPARALNVIGNPMNVIFQQEGGLINLFPPSLSLSTSKDANPGLQTKDYKDRVKFLANSSA